MNIFQVIKEETQPFANKAAVIEDNCRLSYGRLISLAEKIARSLKEKGVRPFHRVGLLCNNSLDYISASLAILSLSAVVVPVSQECTDEEISFILEEISLNFLLIEKGPYDHVGAEKFISDGFLRKEFFIRRIPVIREIPREYYAINPAFIRFSSGTTGKSKGVVLSHETIVERTDAADKALRITSEDSILWVLSMSFHFVVTILLFLRRAATIILCDHNFPESLGEMITKYRASFIYASPFHYDLIIHSDLLPSNSLKIKRLAISTTMKLTEKTANDFFEKFGFELSEAYGIIEVGLPFINFSNERNQRGSAGRILPDYKVKLVDQDSDGAGKIYLKGNGMLDAYFSPWQNRREILENGWFKTEDLGKIDESGFLYIVGRQKNVINFTGMKIFPLEVEAVINQYPLIDEALVYGEAHPRYGQLPVAKIVLKKGIDDAFNLHDLRRFCYKRLARYKVPKEFSFVNQLPKTASGKIKR